MQFFPEQLDNMSFFLLIRNPPTWRHCIPLAINLWKTIFQTCTEMPPFRCRVVCRVAHVYATHHHSPNMCHVPCLRESPAELKFHSLSNDTTDLLLPDRIGPTKKAETNQRFKLLQGQLRRLDRLFSTTSNVYSYQRFTCPMKASTKLGIYIYIGSTHLSSNSHHEDSYSFSGESLSIIINHCCLVAGRSKVYSFNPAFALCR